MHMTQLGRSGLRVSRLCLGTMNFGPYTTPEHSFEILDRGRDAGVNFVETFEPNEGAEIFIAYQAQ